MANGERVEIDGLISLSRGQGADRHGQGGARERNTGAVEAQSRYSAERHTRVGQDEDDCHRGGRELSHHALFANRPTALVFGSIENAGETQRGDR